MKKNILGCIFDLDGVIVDTAKYHYQAWKRLANQLGFDFTHEQNELLKGVSRKKSLEILLAIGGLTLDEETCQKLMTQKNHWYLEFIEKMTPAEILPGVLDFLSELKSQKIKTAIGSASKNTMMILHQIQLDHYFDAIIDGNKVAQAKPDPEVFLKGAEALGLLPEQCIVFEDAIAGIDAAKNAKMIAVGIGEVNALQHADLVIPSFVGITFDDVLQKATK